MKLLLFFHMLELFSVMGAVMIDMVPFAGWTLIPQPAFL